MEQARQARLRTDDQLPNAVAARLDDLARGDFGAHGKRRRGIRNAEQREFFFMLTLE